MYHYTDSGLDNIILENGYRLHKTPYGAGVAIEDIDGLHKVIGRWLVELPKPLNGAEFRFLRHELDLSQKKLARMMGKTELTVGRWERARNKPVDPIADRFIRMLYSDYIKNKPIRELIESLAEMDQVVRPECRLDRPHGGRWRVARAA
jgi:DNA-binding transcriptional regulator YiaG